MAGARLENYEAREVGRSGAWLEGDVTIGIGAHVDQLMSTRKAATDLLLPAIGDAVRLILSTCGESSEQTRKHTRLWFFALSGSVPDPHRCMGGTGGLEPLACRWCLPLNRRRS